MRPTGEITDKNLKHPRLEQSQQKIVQALQTSLAVIASNHFPDTANERIKLLLALSGAESSHVLLHALSRLAQLNSTGASSSGSRQYQITAVHLRSVTNGSNAENDRQLHFARSIAEKLGVEFRCVSQVGHLNSQQRNTLLSSICNTLGADAVLLAEHKTDQAERVLYRLINGELALASSALRNFDHELQIARPLLSVDKKTIDDYALLHKLASLPTNLNGNITPTQSLIRNKLLPVIELRHNPSIVSSLARCADRFSADEQELWLQAEQRLNSCPQATRYSRQVLAALPAALRWRCLALIAKEQLGQLGFELIPYGQLKLIEEFITKDGENDCLTKSGNSSIAKTLRLPSGLCCSIDHDNRVIFSSSADKKGNSSIEVIKSLLEQQRKKGQIEPLDQIAIQNGLLPERLSVPGMVLRNYGQTSTACIEARLLSAADYQAARLRGGIQGSGTNANSLAKAYFDIQRLSPTTLTASLLARPSELIVREFTDGDQVVLAGNTGESVAKILQEYRLTKSFVEKLPLVVCNGQVIWIPGIACSSATTITDSTTEILELSYRRRDRKNISSSTQPQAEPLSPRPDTH